MKRAGGAIPLPGKSVSSKKRAQTMKRRAFDMIYKKPACEIIELDEDIITASNPEPGALPEDDD